MAFITNATRKVVIDHVVATLGRAPTTAELADVTALLNDGASLADVAGYLTSSAAYLSKYPIGQTASEVAADILDAAIVGGVLAADIRSAVIDLIAGGLTGGAYTIATATNAVVAYLSDPANNDNADLGDIAKAFQNRTAAAEEFTKTFTLEGVTVTADDLAGAVEGVTSDAATLTAAKAAFAAGSKSIAEQAVIDAAAEEKAAEEAAAKAAEEKAAADAAAAEKALEDAAAEAAATAAAAITAAEEADAAVTAAQTAADEAAATADETDAEALAAALEEATAADTAAKEALETATKAYDDAITAGVAADVVTAQGNKLIAEDKAEKAAAALVEATTASEEATAADEAAAAAATALEEALAASDAAADAADAAAAAAVEAAAATADTEDDVAAAAQVVAAAAANPVGDAAAAEAEAAAAKAAEEKAAEEKAAADKAAADKAAADAAQSFVLTNSANQTTGGADNFTGDVGNDTFLAFADKSLDNGDVIDGGDGTDTLTARYSVAADTTVNASITNVENIIIDTDEGDAGTDHELNFSAAFTGLQKITVQDAVATDAAGTDDINILTIPMGVELGITRGAADVDVDFQFSGTTGATDSATLTLNTAKADNVTIAGIETVTVNAVGGTSTIGSLTATSATTVNITGDKRVTITDIDDAAVTIDASAHTGTVIVQGIGTGDAIYSANVLKAGSGGNTFNIGANLTTYDQITGGAGTDKLIVANSETTKIAGLSGFETLEIDVADIDVADGDAADNTGTVNVAGTVSADVTTFEIDVTTAADGDVGTVNVTALDDGDTIVIADGGSDTTGAGAAAGISLTTAVTTDTTSNTLTIEFDAIGAVSADASETSGYASVEADEIDFLTIKADKNSTGTVKANGVEVLTAATANTITFTGAGDFSASSVTNSTALKNIVATDMTGALTLTGIDSSVLNYKGAAGADTLTMAGLNASDTIDGGLGTDTLIATSVTSLSATTGKLNITDVETVILQATGANTIDASLLSGVSTLAISGNTPGTQTITNLSAGVKVSVGEGTGAGVAFDNGDVLDISLADATGSDDSLTVYVDNDAAGTDVDLTVEDVETVTLQTRADTNDAQVLLGNTEATAVVVTGGLADALLTLGNLNAATTSLTATAFSGEISMTATSLESFTLTASSAADDDDYTLSAYDDTATIGSTGAVDVDIDGGAGTDTLNLTVKTGFVDAGEIDNFEVINLTVAAGNDIFIGANGTANTDANGLAEATSLTITGGNELSTLEIGDSDAASADNMTASTDIDASTFAGNIFVEFAADVMTSNTDVSAGSLTTDRVYALFDTGGTDVTLALTGVETFTASVDTAADGGEQYNFDVDSAVGLAVVELLTTGAATLVDIDDYVDTVSVQLGSNIAGAVVNFEQDSEVDINLKSNLGTADTVNVILADTGDAAGTVDIDAAGTEVLNITQATTLSESHKLSLAGVSPTALSTLTINIVGGKAAEVLTITDVAAGTSVINASTFASNLVISDRASTATTITGGTGADNIRMENAADILTGGTGSDTLSIAANAIIGGISVDLSSTTDQVTTFNGAANAAVQVGFENVDLSLYTGNGAEITAIKTGSTIIGSLSADQVNFGAGNDTFQFVSSGAAASTGIASAIAVYGGSVTSDRVETFVVADDQFTLDLSAFAFGGAGSVDGADLDAADFASVANVGTAVNKDLSGGGIVYVQNTGAILYVVEDMLTASDATTDEIEELTAGTDYIQIGTIGTLTGVLAETDFNIVT